MKNASTSSRARELLIAAVAAAATAGFSSSSSSSNNVSATLIPRQMHVDMRLRKTATDMHAPLLCHPPCCVLQRVRKHFACKEMWTTTNVLQLRRVLISGCASI